MTTRLQPGDRIFVERKGNATGSYKGYATVIKAAGPGSPVRFLLDVPRQRVFRNRHGDVRKVRVVYQQLALWHKVRRLDPKSSDPHLPVPAEHQAFLDYLARLRGPARLQRCNLWSRQCRSLSPAGASGSNESEEVVDVGVSP